MRYTRPSKEELKSRHTNTEEIICPYCNEIHDDDGFYDEDDGTLENIRCYECGKTFRVYKHNVITYDTEKMDD